MNSQQALAGVKEGDILAGKYRVDKVLGVGGMGVVVAAHHLQLDDHVAIKFLLPDTLGNKDAVARFAREARAAVKIKSEHVARVTDVGTMENGAPYMVMEYLDGGDLAGWIEQRGALGAELAVDFVLQACEAIAEAHALGIVHRDLKPANLFVARLPGGVQSVKVLDFGISKLTGLSGSGNQSSATKTSALMGSPLYMSPEQMQSSKDVDARGDIWALGVILYELVTGVSPFIAETMPELILKIMSSPPPPMQSHRVDVPDGLEAVILRCLEKDRGRRYQSVGELGAALLPFGSKRARASVDRIYQVMQAAGMSASAFALPPSSGAQAAAAAVQAGTSGAFGGTAPGRGGARPAMLVGGALVGLAVLVGVGTLVFRGGGSSAAGAASAAPVVEKVSGAGNAAPTGAPAAAALGQDAPLATPVEAVPAAAPPSAAPAVAPGAGQSPRSNSGHVTVAPRGAPLAVAPAVVPAPAVAPAPSAPKTEAKPAAVAAVAAPTTPRPVAAPPPTAKKPPAGSLIDDRR
jgi:serine/threonine-protein kinase